MRQSPSSCFLVRPAGFGFNPETAGSNSFQQMTDGDEQDIRQRAILEFDRMVDLLLSHDVDVRVFDDTQVPDKPDAQFPNNWISLHEDGTLVLYPMMAPNRRLERRKDIIDYLKRDFLVKSVVDLTGEETSGRFLEGTGSIVFDYVNQIGYACRSPRTNEDLVNTLSQRLGLKPVIFDAVDELGIPVYHTNVLMCIGSRFVVICLDAIHKEKDREEILASFNSTSHKIVAISHAQMNAFAGNMIEIKNRSNEPLVLLSEQAFNSLLPGQVDAISRYAEMIPISIPTIEKFGGGSVRCMVTANFLSFRNG
ncbi:arginine deiminase-related protein [Oscillatoria amoena NRMC-F 0135]|nr:arginine deiminase-related protein [Oscillatoria amoena NRMC-F 0135]